MNLCKLWKQLLACYMKTGMILVRLTRFHAFEVCPFHHWKSSSSYSEWAVNLDPVSFCTNANKFQYKSAILH